LDYSFVELFVTLFYQNKSVYIQDMMFRETKQLRDTQQLGGDTQEETWSALHVRTEARTGMWKELFASMPRSAMFGSE
jgi:hypothetical protein